ncbi:hypothetical protein VPLG_00100 [Vibrio phage eugene 12A10]|uniref:hypothetical protein n=1 Tax=Vibrio phage eugene 12A10 TaxID=573172 RepID=UPI000351B5A6|nr:hypothetical protein VPLG_00100 [Vibrio phage eugene 12A10]AGN51539.1 hypothetical protein VPLG_00100 [Vibrio phage eugene 12A10]
MQTSAKTKVKNLMKTKFFADLTEQDLVTLLLEHERDTRYTAIDILRGMDDEVAVDGINEVIDKEDAIQLTHNLKVGE